MLTKGKGFEINVFRYTHFRRQLKLFDVVPSTSNTVYDNYLWRLNICFVCSTT